MANPATHPINFLQEWCQRHGSHDFPIFTDLGFRGEEHRKEFMCRCVFGKYETIGCGNQKKLAKHEAAKKMLQVLTQNNYFIEENKIAEYKSDSSVKENIGNFSHTLKNPISALQEYCAEQRITYPVYFYCFINGGFSVKCILNIKQTIGTATSKKLAKLSAAAKMCREIGVDFHAPELSVPVDASTNKQLASQTTPMNAILQKTDENSFTHQTMPTIQKICARYTDLSEPTFQFKSRHNVTYVLFECRVGPFVGLAAHFTEEGAKALAAKSVLNDLLVAGYSEEGDSPCLPEVHKQSQHDDVDNNNDGESFIEYISESDDNNAKECFSIEYPVVSLDKLCNSHRSLPKPTYEYKHDRRTDNYTVICRVGSVYAEGKDGIRSYAKVLAAQKTLERLVVGGFPREDLLHGVQQKCYGELYPMCGLANLCNIYKLNPPLYKIVRYYKDCFVITCTAGNVCAESSDKTRKGAKNVAAAIVLNQLLGQLNIGLSSYNRYEPTNSFESSSKFKREKQVDLKFVGRVGNSKSYSYEGEKYSVKNKKPFRYFKTIPTHM